MKVRHKFVVAVPLLFALSVTLAGCGTSEEEKAQVEAEAQRQEAITQYQEKLDTELYNCEWEKNIIAEVKENGYFEETAAHDTFNRTADDIHQQWVNHYTGAIEWLTKQKESAGTLTLPEVQKAIEILDDRPGNENVCRGSMPQFKDYYERSGLDYEASRPDVS